MKISYEWIKDYIELEVSAEEFARGLTMSGSEVGGFREEKGDYVMELEITSNRPDCLNMIGLAREASAVFDRDLKLPRADIAGSGGADKAPRVECVVSNKELCPRYTARVITGVKIKESEGIIKKRVEAIGMRRINNIVDVTNFCLMENGQPLHAFDLDKIKGGKVIVREAAEGEKIITIDGQERELSRGMLVIADSERPVAIAGIMGGKDTEVSAGTENILLESAYFDPLSVRRTARALGLFSDSSYRFERGVDKNMIAAASDRAAGLIVGEAGGDVRDFYDTGALKAENTVISFDINKAEKKLGACLQRDRVIGIFKRLGMGVEDAGFGEKLSVSVPSFREDLKEEVDLLEEVARIYGYGNIKPTFATPVFDTERKQRSRMVLEKIREILSGAGLNEIMTYSLINEKAKDIFSGVIKGQVVSLANPLSEEHKVLTPHLLDGMMKAASWNINRKNTDLKLFETGKLYSYSRAPVLKSRLTGERAFHEEAALSVGMTGVFRKNWKEGEREVTLFDVKGLVECLFRGLKLIPVFRKTGYDCLVDAADIFIKGKNEACGFLGKVSGKILEEYNTGQEIYVCQIALGEIIEEACLENRYHSIPRFPSSTRDVSILCDKSLPAGGIHGVILECGEQLIQQISVADVYEGKQIPGDKKSLTYSIRYGLDTRTLKEEEVESVHSRVKEALQKKFDISFR
ncbi:MAG: phenylalanine--tRNA ligase subunit beta [Candidatus Omnitrophota bacterium]